MGRTVRPRSVSGARCRPVKRPRGGPPRGGGWGRVRLWPKATQPETATRGSPYEGPGVGGAPFRAVLGRRDFGARSWSGGRGGVGGLCGRQGYEALPNSRRWSGIFLRVESAGEPGGHTWRRGAVDVERLS